MVRAPFRIVFVLIVLLPSGSQMLTASTFRPMTVRELTSASDAVVEGTVVRVESSWNAEHTMIFTDAEVLIEEVLRGQPGRSVVVRTAGGTVDGYTLLADGFPVFTEGERVLLFLEAEEGYFRVTGYQLGQYRLQPASDGRMLAVPAMGAPFGASDVRPGWPETRSLDELRETVRNPSPAPDLRRSAEPFVLLSPPRTWDDPLTFIIDARGLPDIDDEDGGVTAVVQAINSTEGWNSTCAGVLVWAVAGSVAGFSLGDGIPMLNFRDPLHVCTGNCLAVTFTGFFSQRPDGSYRIDDADIVFNPAGVDWTSEGEDPGGVGCSSEIYVEGVAVHQVGHALGLGHTDVSGATMFPSVAFCNNGAATTEADDRDGVVALYGCSNTVRAGIDAWATPGDGSSSLSLTFPQGFFCGGRSDFFEREVVLEGRPLTTSPGGVLGDADTVVLRPDDAPFSDNVATTTLRIVALSLTSRDPIEVTCPDGSTELWDMDVSLDGPQDDGSLTVTRPDATAVGGTFHADLPVKAKLVITRSSTGETAGTLKETVTLHTAGASWSLVAGEGGITYQGELKLDADLDGDPELGVPGVSNFAVGWSPVGCKQPPCKVPTIHDGPHRETWPACSPSCIEPICAVATTLVSPLVASLCPDRQDGRSPR